VLIGFPQDEGVRRNQGRPGAALAPDVIRRFFYRLTPADAERGIELDRLGLVDLGNVLIAGGLEQSQEALAEVVATVLAGRGIPIVLGGGHETAYGSFLGYVRAGMKAALLNLDAHLDVRPTLAGLGHSGSPFRQALEHPHRPLPGGRYACLGAQPHAVSREHLDYLRQRGGVVRWAEEVRGRLAAVFAQECERLQQPHCPIHVSLDADVVGVSEMPGVSAPNSAGLAGLELLAAAEQAGRTAGVTGLDLVEINPELDRDGQSARWGALALWRFLCGLCVRG
jgi:formiminoglutamase